MRLGGFDADPQKAGGFLGGLAFGDELKELSLSRAERFWREFRLCQIRLSDRFGGVGSQVELSSRDLLDRLDQFFRCAVLPHIAAHTRAEGEALFEALGFPLKQTHG